MANSSNELMDFGLPLLAATSGLSGVNPELYYSTANTAASDPSGQVTDSHYSTMNPAANYFPTGQVTASAAQRRYNNEFPVLPSGGGEFSYPREIVDNPPHDWVSVENSDDGIRVGAVSEDYSYPEDGYGYG